MKWLYDNSDRKFKIAILSLILCMAGFLLTAFFPLLANSYGTFVMALGMVLGLYGGANVGSKWVLAKHGVLSPQEEEEEVATPEQKQDKP